MKKHANETAEQRRYRHRLLWKKVFLYLAWAASVVAVFAVSFGVFETDYENRVEPQIDRAVIQVAQLLPQMEQNETALRNAYNEMIQSWEKILKSDEFSVSGRIVRNRSDASFEDMVGDTLSWLNRVTKLKVGRDGLMAVISKETGRIVAHPDEQLVGDEFLIAQDSDSEDVIVSIEDINALASPDDLKINYGLLLPFGRDYDVSGRLDMLIIALSRGVFGSVISYRDYYIVCGVPVLEFVESVIFNSMLVTIIFMVAMWLFVHWICLEMQAHRESARSMRNKLITISALLCAALFGISVYVQMLSNVANDLKTMAKHANVAVDTLKGYEAQSTELNNYLDEYYLVQCGFAMTMIENDGAQSLTAKDMQRYADALRVKYIYLFDRNGHVVVTNSPFDSFAISDDPANYTYQFRRVLEGLDHIVMAPLKDEWQNEYIQYIAMNRRSEDDKNDGMVLIGIDPELRDRLLKPLSVNTVLENLVIGLPDAALAVDKETMKITATTGLGYKGSAIEDLGITADMLVNKFCGSVKINGESYYAGIAESSDYYLITAVHRSGYFGPIVNSLKLTLVALAACLVIIVVTLIRYQQVVIDGAPEQPEPSDDAGTEVQAALDDENRGMLFSGFTNILRNHERKDMQDRWHMNDIPKDQMTPEQRIGKIVYKLMTLFCLVILLPTLYQSLNGRIKPYDLNNLAFVISGNWQKGVNIFALTTTVFLLCAMYVVVALLNQILYRIAKYSDRRVETVCLLVKNAFKYVCVIVFVYYGLSQFGVQTQTLLASAGILSMMISFGAKDLVSDIIAGFFTIVEGTYKVGDFITVGGWSGTVAEIGLRTTRIRAFAETKIISNSSIRDVINANGEVARMVLKAPISYGADLQAVEAMLGEELPKLMDVIPGLVKPPQYEGIESLGDSSVNLRIVIFVKNSKKFPALRSLTREIKLLFDREGIEIPFNQLVLHKADDAGKH